MANNNDNNDACISQYSAQIRQRTELQLFQGVVPPVRLEVTNPYVDQPTLTPFRTAMRRKFDILQYPGTAGASVQGGATARQRYIRLSRGGSVIAKRMSPQSAVDARYTVCDIENPIPVGSSGVPCGGDTEVLFLDLAVPQYMLNADPRLDRNYTEFADIPADPFAFYYSTQTLLSTNAAAAATAAWATIRLSTAGGRSARRFPMQLTVPLALLVTGTYAASMTAPTTTTISVARTMHLYYNDTVVADSVAPDPLQVTLQSPTPGSGGSSSSESSINFSAAVYLEPLTANLALFSAADSIAVFTARVHAQTAFTLPVGVESMTATVVAHLPSPWNDSSTNVASITWPSKPTGSPPSSSVLLLEA